jgi:hypothetical protein
MRLREQVAGLTLSKVPVGVPIFVAVVGAVFSKLDHYLAGSFLAAGMLVLAIWCKNSLRPEDQLGFKISLLCCATSAVVFGFQATNGMFGLVPVYFTFISYFFWHKSGGLLLGWVNLVLICSVPKN